MVGSRQADASYISDDEQDGSGEEESTSSELFHLAPSCSNPDKIHQKSIASHFIIIIIIFVKIRLRWGAISL